MKNEFGLTGFELLTVDMLVSVEPDHPLFDSYAVGNIYFLSSAQWREALTLLTNSEMDVYPGGNVGNALAIYARVLNSLDVVHQTMWRGGCSPERDSRIALRSLQRDGIRLEPTFHLGASTRTLVFSETNAPDVGILILEGTWPAKMNLDLNSPDKLLIGLDMLDDARYRDELLELPECSLAIVVNHVMKSNDEAALLRDLAERRKLFFVSGTEDELAGLDAHFEIPLSSWPAQYDLHLLRTRGAKGGESISAGTEIRKRFRAPSVNRVVSTVGAGDCIAGATLAYLSQGMSLERAISEAGTWVREVLQSPYARNPGMAVRRDASPLLECQKECEEIRKEIDYGSGIAVLSGGQTGLDQIALEQAAPLGLPSHAIFPKGFAVEDGILSAEMKKGMGEPRTYELDVQGYTSRTWACAYVSDGTLYIKNHESSGYLETRRACVVLNRPLWTIEGEQADPVSLARELVASGIRVLNVAGHRGSRLQKEQADFAREFLPNLYKEWAALYPTDSSSLARLLTKSGISKRSNGALRIAVPSSGPMCNWICTRLGLEGSPLPITIESMNIELLFGRPVDFGTWLLKGVISGCVCGADMLVEGQAPAGYVFDLGLFNSSIVLIGKGPQSNSSAIATQYPRLATRLGKEVARGVAGSAETWIFLELAQSALDTWATGKTARAFGLEPLGLCGTTSLVCLFMQVGERERAFVELLSGNKRLELPFL